MYVLLNLEDVEVYESYSSEDRSQLLRKFLEMEVIPYFKDNRDHFDKNETYHELKKASKGKSYDLDKIDFNDLFSIWDGYIIIKTTEL